MTDNILYDLVRQETDRTSVSDRFEIEWMVDQIEQSLGTLFPIGAMGQC